MAKSPNYRAPALEKGLDILELIARETAPLSLAEISDQLGRSKGEIFRMIMALEERGYIARTQSGDGYRITNRLFMLGMAQPPIRSLLEASLSRMQGVADALWQSCHLVVASDDEIVVIARVDSPGDLGYAVRIGHKRPIHLSASGIVLFAFQPKEMQEQWLRRLRKKRDFVEAEFLARVKQVRKDGYGRFRSTRVKSVLDISLPLFQGDVPIATIAVPYVDQTPEVASVESAVESLIRAAEEITAAIAASPMVAPAIRRPADIISARHKPGPTRKK